jgi:hypothetical protein
LCGKHERRKVVFSLTLWRTEIGSEYHEWFNRKAYRAHSHDWIYVGCHERGNMIWGMTACSMRNFGFLEKIPQLPTESRSLKAVDTLFSLSEAVRLRELEDSDFLDLNPYSTDYAAWWSSHPHWQDVFPAPQRK